MCENTHPIETHYLVKLRHNRDPLRKKKGPLKLLSGKIYSFFEHSNNSSDIIFLKFYTLEQPLKMLSSTFLNVNMIFFYVFLVFLRKNYKSGRNKELFIEIKTL